MKKTVENEFFSLTGISSREMEVIKNAFTLLVRQTDNELANSLLSVIKEEGLREIANYEDEIMGKKVGMRKKKSSLRQ